MTKRDKLAEYSMRALIAEEKLYALSVIVDKFINKNYDSLSEETIHELVLAAERINNVGDVFHAKLTG